MGYDWMPQANGSWGPMLHEGDAGLASLAHLFENRSVAVVGSSGNLLRQGLGAQIDSHDVVIRVNSPILAGYELDVGAKTSIRVICDCSFWHACARGVIEERETTIFSHARLVKPHDQPNASVVAARLSSIAHRRLHQAFSINYEWARLMAFTLLNGCVPPKCAPSSGFQALAVALSITRFVGSQPPSVFGFGKCPQCTRFFDCDGSNTSGFSLILLEQEGTGKDGYHPFGVEHEVRRTWLGSGALERVIEPECNASQLINRTAREAAPDEGSLATRPPSISTTKPYTHAGLLPYRWCIVTTDDRSRVPLTTYWSLHAAVNEVYAYAHGYGFVYVQQRDGVDGTEAQRDGGGRLSAVAQVLLHGTPAGRKCLNVLYLDPDAHVANFELSIDGYIERARSRGDDGLAKGGDWKVLFASDYWLERNSFSTGAFFIRNHLVSICLLWRWRRESHRRDRQRFPHARREIEAIRRLVRLNASQPQDLPVRVLPTARFRRRDDHAWSGPLAWARSAAAVRNETYRYDDFVHAGVKRHPRDVAKLIETLATAWRALLGNTQGFACKCVPDRETCNATVQCQPAPPQKSSYQWTTHHMDALSLSQVLDRPGANSCEASMDGRP